MILINTTALETLRHHAERHPFTAEECRKIIAGELSPPGEMEDFVLYLDSAFNMATKTRSNPGLRLVYSIGMYPKIAPAEGEKDYAPVRHMSISKAGLRKWEINKEEMLTIECIASWLGFPALTECQITMENGIFEVLALIPKPQ